MTSDARWHLRQHELGACRCNRRVVSDAGRLAFEDECDLRPASIADLIAAAAAYDAQRARDAIRLPDATGEQAVAASAPEASDVADGALDEREAAPPAPLRFRPDPVIEVEAAMVEIKTLREMFRWPGRSDGEDG